MNQSLTQLKPKYKIWLESDDGSGVLGDGKWILLKTIDETGSLTAAVEKLGISYRKTWNNIKKIEQMLGFPLLETSRGGTIKGMSVLTPEARKIVWAFDQFHQVVDPMINKALVDFSNNLK